MKTSLKKTFCSGILVFQVILLFFTGGLKLEAQVKGVGISEDAAIIPDKSAILELQSVERGLLIPRMTTLERLNIFEPANGLTVYDTDTKSFWYYDSSVTLWKALAAGAWGTSNQLLGMNAAGNANEYKSLVGTANQVNIVHGVGSITLSTPQNIHTGASPTFSSLNLTNPLTVSNGGTGRNSLPLNNLIYGNNAGNVNLLGPGSAGTILMTTATGAPGWTTLNTLPSTSGILQERNGGTGYNNTFSNGQLLIGDATGGLTRNTLTGTSNQLFVTNDDGSITLSLPQDIHTGAEPVFFGLTLEGLTPSAGVYTNSSRELTSAPPVSGTIGYWTRNDALDLLTPANTGDDVATTDGGTITSSGLLTGQSGVTVSGGALTINNQPVNQTGGGQVTFAGNVDATNGVDITGAPLTVTNQAITQTGTEQVTFGGNVDAGSGVDVTGDLTVTNNADIDGTLDVAGATTTTDITNSGNIGTNTLTTSGAATLNSAAVTNGATVGGDLTVTGVTALNGAVGVGDAEADAVTISGTVQSGTLIAGQNAVVFDGSTADATNRTTFSITDPTAARTINFPDRSGTVVLSQAGSMDNNLAVSTDAAGQLVNATDGQPFNVNSDVVNIGNAGTDQVTIAGNVDADNGLDVIGATNVEDFTATGTVDLGNDAIQSNEIADGQVQTADIADNNVTLGKIADGGNNQLLTTDGTGNPQWEDKSIFTTSTLTDSHIFVGNGSNVATDVALSGDATISNAGVLTIADGAITTNKIADLNVTTGKLADDAVTNAKLADDAITIDKILNGTANQVLKTNSAGDAVEWGLLDASNITFTAGGNILATNVQDAIEELDNEKANISGQVFTGAISATNLSGTNTGDVTLAGESYLSVLNQVITASDINLGTNVTGTLPIANGGTGSATQNFVDLTTAQTVAGNKTWSNLATFNQGLTATGGVINLNNDATANAVNIATGTNTGQITLGNAGNTVSIPSTILGQSPLVFDGLTADANKTTFVITDPTGTNTITFPNASGTVALETAGNSWNVDGNAGTNPTDNFIGTTDNQDLVFRANNSERMRVQAATGDLIFGDAVSGTLKSQGVLTVQSEGNELILRQDGGTYGPSILRIKNETAENGAIFETTDADVTLVDFIFKTAADQRNIRYESRATYARAGGPSFHLGGAVPDVPTLALGDSYAHFNTGVRIGYYNSTVHPVPAPTALLHLNAGTTVVGSAPLKFTSGPLLSTAETGAIEFLNDKYYGTITTGSARKTFAFLESPSFITPDIGSATATSIDVSGHVNAESAVINGPFNFAVSTSVTDAYTVTLNPAPTSYSNGLVILFRPSVTNSGSASMNVNGLGARTILRGNNGAVLTGSEISANGISMLVYYSDNFYLIR